MRTITIVSTKNSRIEKHESSATTWGDLKAEIQDKYDLENLKAVENVGKTTLEHIDAVLPEGDFRLFLRPSKTKSGADYRSMGFSELRAIIKKNDDLKAFLNANADNGRNWTQLKTVELQEGVARFFENSGNNSTSKKKTSAPASSKKSGAKSQASLEVTETDPTVVIDNALGMIEGAASSLSSLGADSEEVNTIVGKIKKHVKKLLKSILGESEEEKAARLEQEEIERELREIEEGF